jgi:hypothetical protein
MLKEQSREIPQSGADEIDPAMNAPRVLGEIRGAADADALLANIEAGAAAAAAPDDAFLAAAKEQFRKRTRVAWEKTVAASMAERAAKVIVWAFNQTQLDGAWRDDLSVARLNYLANRVDSFATSAIEFIERCDGSGLNGAITALNYAVREADKSEPTKPPLTPGTDNFALAGWNDGEYRALRSILSKQFCGVQKGDHCVSVDAKGARLASGKSLSREQIAEHVQPIEHKMFAVGSLPSVLNAIRRAQS